MKTDWILLVVFHMAGFIQIGRSQEECEVNILSADSEVFVPLGDFFLLNCSYTCPNAILKTRLTRSNPQNGTNWKSAQVLVDDFEQSNASCVYKLPEKLKDSAITLMAYVLPSHVTIDLQGELEEDKQHNITCIVHDVAPVRYLNISVTRGGEVIHSKAYKEDHRKGKVTVKETYEFTASRGDNLQMFTCQATLLLGSLPNTTVQSSSISVRTYALPEDPLIRMDKWIEFETSPLAECLVSNGFPTENVTLQMFINDELLDKYPGVPGNSQTRGIYKLSNSSYHLGLNNVTCISRLSELSRNNTMYINIYEAPELVIGLSNHIVGLNNSVTVDCNITNSNPADYCASISVNKEKKEESCGSSISYSITVSRREPKITVTCTVFLGQNPNISQTSTETIAVHYVPQFTEVLCPKDNILVEGHKTTFPCTVDGSPKPFLNCSSEVWSAPPDNFTVARNMSTGYLCVASNSRGRVRKHVHITVEYPPGTPTLIFSPDRTISNGELFNVTCQSDAWPAPEYRWNIPTEDHVTYSQGHSSITVNMASVSHSGTYTCQVTNRHGTSSRQQEVVIVGDNTWMLIVIGIVIALVVVAVVLLIWCLVKKRNGRRGFYNLLTRNRSKKLENGLNHEHTSQNTTKV
ncbi:intercellular adhesion molecule 1-like [Mixophyes fleayi]|uniref:intercellular adhesion molecule 1-like n=1 Tax=Mixophyes fleayi TaxID=3061075 RepID=UPI003F4DC8D4